MKIFCMSKIPEVKETKYSEGVAGYSELRQLEIDADDNTVIGLIKDQATLRDEIKASGITNPQYPILGLIVGGKV